MLCRSVRYATPVYTWPGIQDLQFCLTYPHPGTQSARILLPSTIIPADRKPGPATTSCHFWLCLLPSIGCSRSQNLQTRHPALFLTMCPEVGQKNVGFYSFEKTVQCFSKKTKIMFFICKNGVSSKGVSPSIHNSFFKPNKYLQDECRLNKKYISFLLV